MSSLCAHLIAGKAIPADAAGATPVYNPSRGEVIAQAPAGGAAEVGQAVDASRTALPGWVGNARSRTCPDLPVPLQEMPRSTSPGPRRVFFPGSTTEAELRAGNE